MIWRFANRSEAGKLLAERLIPYKTFADVLVLALPPGGVPVAIEIARALDAPLDVFLARKLGVPGFPEMAMGAIASAGARYLDHELTAALRISPAEIERAVAQATEDLARSEESYRRGRGRLELEGRTILLVDDGGATGSSLCLVIAALRRLKPARIVVASPVVPACTCQELRLCADDVICLLQPQDFRAIRSCYQQFPQVSDEEVCGLLEAAGRPVSQVAA